MQTEKHLTIREATPQEDLLKAQHFYQMWQDMSIPEDAINPDWHDITLEYINTARRDLSYKAFVAIIDNVIVGSVSCQIFADLCPNVFKPEYRKSGYIWGIYVEPPYRRQGIAKRLTSIAVEYLKAIACTRVLLNTSPAGKRVYSNLGFCEGNLMQLDLI